MGIIIRPIIASSPPPPPPPLLVSRRRDRTRYLLADRATQSTMGERGFPDWCVLGILLLDRTCYPLTHDRSQTFCGSGLPDGYVFVIASVLGSHLSERLDRRPRRHEVQRLARSVDAK